ncbi:MAG: hypothetical protein PHN64_05000 [Desulfovibrionaceae bacterium]|nr:hypothetical protein [Desulfovibrionaceae bacterium]
MKASTRGTALAQACTGSIVLYAALVIVLLGSLTFLLQGMILPLMTTGYTSEQIYQVDALEASFKNIFRQRLGKSAKGSDLWQQLSTMNGKELTITDSQDTFIGSITPTFTPYWFRTGSTASTSLPALPAGIKIPPHDNKKSAMVAIAATGISRFTYDWSQQTIEQPDTGTATIPANADVYFALLSNDAQDSLNLSDRTLSLSLKGSRQTDIPQFAKSLPEADGLLGALGGEQSTTHRNQLNAAFVYGKQPSHTSATLTLPESAHVVGSENSLQGYDVLLGQHVLAELAITLPSGAKVHRQWRFNGRTSFNINDDYNKDVIVPDENQLLSDLVVERNPLGNDNAGWAQLGILPSSAAKGWAAVNVLTPSANQPNHAQFMKNINGTDGKNETTLKWARLVIKQPMLQNYTSTPVNTSYKLSFAPYRTTSFSNSDNFFYGLVLREQFYGKNPHDGAKGLVVGLLYGDLDLEFTLPGWRRVQNYGYTLDPALLPGFAWYSKNNAYYITQDSTNITQQNLNKYYATNTAPYVGIFSNYHLELSGYITFSPRILVWGFDDNGLTTNGDDPQTYGKMTLLAVGKPKDGSFPSTNNFTALHVNLEETRDSAGTLGNDLRIVLAKPDFTTPRWISMEANNPHYQPLQEAVHIKWLWVNTKDPKYENQPLAKASLVANPRQNSSISQAAAKDEPKNILRIEGFTGAEYNYAGIYSSLVGTPQKTYLRDFGMAVSNKKTATTQP